MKRLLTSLILLCTIVGFTYAQRTVVGTVKGDDGEALIGASVRVKGTNSGAVTDAFGKYSVSVPAGSNTLVFTYTGFTTLEIPLGASNVVDAVMESGTVLREAVVTALGISRQEKSLGYGVTSVKGEDVARSGEVNVIQGLAAKSSGVQIIGSAGTPGASSKILIRGNSTFTGENQPLIVVDGVPYDNQTLGSEAADYPFNATNNGVNNSNRALDLNPADVESINILKGPAAAALYGTRAANGVLLITTKKGGKGMSVNVSSSVAFDQVNKLPEIQMEYGQGTGGGSLTSAEGTYVDQTPLSWGPRIGTAGVPEVAQAYDNLDLYFKTGVSYTNNISISMGSENTSFRLSYGNVNQGGIVPNTELKRNSFRLTANSEFNRFSLSATAAYVNTKDIKAQNGSNLSGVMLGLTRMPPSFNILGGPGPNGYDTRDGQSWTYFSLYDNPLWSAYNNPMTGDVDRITGNISGTFSAFSWLDLTARLGADAYTDDRQQVFAVGAQDPPAPVGEIWENTKRRLEVNADMFASFKPQLQGQFGVNATLGLNLNSRRDDDLFARGRNLAIPNFYHLSNASDLYNSEELTEKRIAGIFGELGFSYANQLYLNFTGRNDWASTFGESARKNGFFYPSANLAWVFSEILPSTDILSFGKVRASYARAGIEPVAYRTKTYYLAPFITDGFTDGFGFPYGGQNGFSLSSRLGNANLEPEINTTTEFGVNLKFLRNKIDLDVNYYISKSSNLLVLRPLAGSSGAEEVYTNIGKMENKGWEIELGLHPVSITNFKWSIYGNFSRNENTVTQLAEGVDEINIETAFSSIGSFAIVGQPYGAFYATRWERTADGQLMIQANGLPLRAATRGNVGNPYPDWTAGIRNVFEVYGVTINGLLDIRHGGSLWNGTDARLNRFGTTLASGDRDRTYVIEGVKISDGTPNDIAISANQYFSNFVGDGTAAVEQHIQDGGWIRLRELTLGYNIPIPNNKYVKGINLYVTGRNLWLSTDYIGVDPETSLNGAGSNIGGFDYFNMPNTKSYIVGLNLSF
ncbi:MAG: SusC/RagA family TonB-linked outer membrane protein [Lewinellaceae bacterium]|nr:SusC/RagA family TonB-linked outer membrane protein [Saprospiraceae bacterium]MCB9334032.1 SusC/RagA family TonB-linked outer membrane protein [Lewinellaceae bacterium]